MAQPLTRAEILVLAEAVVRSAPHEGTYAGRLASIITAVEDQLHKQAHK